MLRRRVHGVCKSPVTKENKGWRERHWSEGVTDSWASISLLKDLISILLAMGDCNTFKQDMARSAFLEAVPMWTKRQASGC